MLPCCCVKNGMVADVSAIILVSQGNVVVTEM